MGRQFVDLQYGALLCGVVPLLFALCRAHFSCEHSGKVRSSLVDIWLWKIYFSLLSGSVSFSLCCTDVSTKDETVLSAD